MATSTKRAKRVRTAAEFNPVKLAEGLKPPRFTGAAYAWDLEAIRAARQQQMEGNFQLPAKLAEAQKSDDGIFTALRNRLSPARGLPVGLIAANATAKAQRIKDEAEALYGIKGVGCPSGAFSDINECIADHGVAFGVNVLTPRADGSRVDIEHTYWPIEHVYWDRTTRAFLTRLDNGQLETICHGDGRWTIYTQHSSRPWRWGALLSTALIWADRQFGVRDRSRASTSHGNAKMIGELPEGVAIDSPEGEAFLLLLRTMHEALPYGIRPAGSKTEMMVNQSASWQIFKEIIDSRLGDAARVYLGHDGTIRAVGGNYIKDGYLFGVSADIVEADLRTLERGFYEGVLQPWTALNFGDSSLAPMRRWLMPDADEDTRRASIAERRVKFWADLAAARAAGVVVDQAFVTALADEFGVRAPQLADASPLPTPEAAQPDGGEVQASESPTDEAAANLAAKMTEAALERCEHQRSNRCWMCGIERVRDFEVIDGKPTWKVAWRPIGDASVTAASPTYLS